MPKFIELINTDQSQENFRRFLITRNSLMKINFKKNNFLVLVIFSLILFFLGFILFRCFSWQVFSFSDKILYYDKTKECEHVFFIELDKNDIRIKKIEQWINKRWWVISFTAYKPTRCLKSDTLYINLLDEVVVLSYRKNSSKNWIQYTSSTDEVIKELFILLQNEDKRCGNWKVTCQWNHTMFNSDGIPCDQFSDSQ